MQAYWNEFSPTGGDFEEAAEIPFPARHVEVIHVGGASIAEVSFDAQSPAATKTVHGKVAASGVHPISLLWHEQDGVTKVFVKTNTETVAVRAWI